MTARTTIDPDELVERFKAASGPGGQNVNKVATAVELRFDVRASPSLPPDVKERLLRLASHLATRDGVLVIEADRFRSQARNRADARERLDALVAEASIRPVRRRPTRPTWGSQVRRLDEKGRRATLKRGRGRPPDRD